MKRIVCLAGWLALSPAVAQAQGIAVGWDGRTGATLIGELNCLACHEGSVGTLPIKQAPILAEVGARITPQYLRSYLANLHAAKPGTAMPDLLHGMPEARRTAAIEALTHYLVSLGGPIAQRGAGVSASQISRGQDLYHSVGCVACHAPITPPPKQKQNLADIDDEPKVPLAGKQSVPLGDLASKTTVPALAKFLLDPLHVRPSGRMPSLNLDPSEANAVAAYLLREQISADEKAPAAGLIASYYPGNFTKVPNFATLKPTFQGDVTGVVLDEIVAKANANANKKPGGGFAVRFAGEIEVPSDGAYRFWVHSDDGSLLRIDNKLVVDNDGAHSPAEKDATVNLRKGRHTLDVGYFNGAGGYELALSWQPPGAAARVLVPPGAFFHETATAMIPKGIVEFPLQPQLVESGRTLFESLGCASCHATQAAPKAPAIKLTGPTLAKLDPQGKGGCLDDAVAAGRPRFVFDAEQRAGLRKTLADWKTGVPTWDLKTVVDHRMNALSCYACHVRDGKGGPDKQRSAYFTYEVPVDLGDEGRLPPILTGVGAKLTTEGFDDALVSGKRYRTSMSARMPSFGKDNVGHLPEQFAKADAGRIPGYEPKFAKTMTEDGRKLAGRTALACINCHAWGPHRLPGAEGLDLIQTPRRIRPEWFHAWLQNPNAIRPGTRMPTAWPDGKSFFPTLQGGDVDRQMDAIWAYLKAGDKGGLPAGLGPTDTNYLVPTDEPIVFRTFLDKVGAHAILVGFPQRLHVAFDANRVRMVVAWSGDFVSTKAAWDGRAGQYAPVPSASTLVFPEGPPFARLPSLTDPWPGDLPKKKIGSNRTPEGWHFVGYQYGENRVPTFLYRIGDIEVEETPLIEARPKGTVLLRRFRLTAADAPTDLLLRVAAGKMIIPRDKAFRVDQSAEYRVLDAAGEPQIRTVAAGQELVVPIRFQPDAARKTNTATVTMEIGW